MGILYGFSLVIIILCNIGIAEFIHRRVIKEYKRLNSSARAQKKLRHMQYIHVGITVIFLLLSVFVIAQLVEILYGNYVTVVKKGRFFIENIYLFLYLTIIWTGSSMIYYKTYKILETITDESKHEWVWRKFLAFVIFMFFLSVNSIRRHMSEEIGTFYWILEISLAFFGAITINVFYTYFMLVTLRPEPIGDISAIEMIADICKKHNLKKYLIRQFPSTKINMYNAYVLGMLTKKILISDYLIRHLTTKNLEAIIAHEIGHIKMHHLLIQFLFISFAWLFFRDIATYSSNVLENLISYRISPLIIRLTFTLSFALFILPLISRIHERQADRFVIRSGISSEELISALNNLHKVNDLLGYIGYFREKLSTHPSLENRIKYINEYAKTMVK